jgi:hypothetical protein
MRRFTTRAVVLIALLAGAEGSQAHPAACFWIHGRLFAANGTPTFRIWRIGTRRIFGVVDANGSSESDKVLPDKLRALVQPDAFAVFVFGDFEVCPLEKDHPGRMRTVRLAGGRNFSTRPAKPY